MGAYGLELMCLFCFFFPIISVHRCGNGIFSLVVKSCIELQIEKLSSKLIVRAGNVNCSAP